MRGEKKENRRYKMKVLSLEILNLGIFLDDELDYELYDTSADNSNGICFFNQQCSCKKADDDSDIL